MSHRGSPSSATSVSFDVGGWSTRDTSVATCRRRDGAEGFQGEQFCGILERSGLTWARINMNSLDMPNTLSMYDTLSCGFVLVNLARRSVERQGQEPRSGASRGRRTTSSRC